MTYDIEDLAKRQFTGLSLADLKAVAKDLGINIAGNPSEATVRERLCNAIGEFNPVIEAAPTPKDGRTTTKPENLSGFGRWTGRRHRVKMIRKDQQDTAKGVPIGWEGAGSIYAVYGAPYVDLPEPHFNNLKNSVQDFFTVSAFVERGNIVREETGVESVQCYPFEYRGVTPGTENLPGSLLEWYQWEAERKDYFRKFRQERLEEIFAELYGYDPQKDPRSGQDRMFRWDKTKVRKEILRFLGPTYLASGFDREAEEEEEEAQAA